MSLIKKLVTGERLDKTPIWLMRQAGRYLPEYQEIKSKSKSFLEMCYTPEIASEITLQPIRRFDFDAAIIFSDILVIPHSLGMDLEFIEKMGPVLSKISLDSSKDIDNLQTDGFEKKLKPVYEAIKIVKQSLNKEKDLIGFAGAPWTLFAYMIEGSGSKNFDRANIALIEKKNESKVLIEKLVDVISKHLIKQIEAGATSVQIFDSWAGELSPCKYQKVIIEPTKRIVENVKSKHKDIPVIGFPRGSGFRYKDYVEQVGVDVLSVDQELPMNWIKENLSNKAVIQGNLDPMILLEGEKEISCHVKNIVKNFEKGRFIFNLGRGVSQKTPIKNVEYLVRLVREEI